MIIIMGILKFSERLYTLDVGEIPQTEIPRIVDPNEMDSRKGVILCYEPTKEQLIQLALIVWQVATRERNSLRTGTSRFSVAECRCTATRNCLKRLLLPFVEGDQDKAGDLCITLLRENKSNLDKYVKNWKIVPRPNTVWVDEENNDIFICQYNGQILVGLNPTNYMFSYTKK